MSVPTPALVVVHASSGKSQTMVGRRSGQDSVECSGSCASRLHRHCAGLSKAAFDKIQESGDPFFCAQCRLDKQELELNSLRELVGVLSRELDAVKLKLPPQMLASYPMPVQWGWVGHMATTPPLA